MIADNFTDLYRLDEPKCARCGMPAGSSQYCERHSAVERTDDLTRVQRLMLDKNENRKAFLSFSERTDPAERYIEERNQKAERYFLGVEIEQGARLY